MRFLLDDEVADILALPAGKAPGTVINLLKISGTLQQFKIQTSVNAAFNNQYSNFKKQQEGMN